MKKLFALLLALALTLGACTVAVAEEPVTITFSAGIAEFRNGEATEVTFERADQALYRAKGAGRNRVEQAA